MITKSDFENIDSRIKKITEQEVSVIGWRDCYSY